MKQKFNDGLVVALVITLLTALLLLACSDGSDLNATKELAQNRENIKIIPLVNLRDDSNSDKGYHVNYNFNEGAKLYPEQLVAVNLLNSNYNTYFHSDGRGKIASQYDVIPEFYYSVLWEIKKEGETKSLLSSSLSETTFMATDNRGKALAATASYNNALLYLRLGKELVAGNYVIHALINDSNPTGARVLEEFQHKIEILEPFKFPDNLTLTAKGSVFKADTNAETELDALQLTAVPVYTLSSSPKSAWAELKLKKETEYELQVSIFYDFKLQGNDNYRIISYKQGLFPDEGIANGATTLPHTVATTIVPTANTYNHKVLFDNLPLPIKGYAAKFTWGFNIVPKAASAIARPGKVILIVEDQFGRQGELNVSLNNNYLHEGAWPKNKHLPRP